MNRKPTKYYLLGWVAGSRNEQASYGDFLIEENVYFPYNKKANSGGFNGRETKVFKTQKGAIAAILKQKEFNLKNNVPSHVKYFVRGWRYETNNPENAKGLTEWTEEHGKEIFV